ncbi:MAG: hypothetical protein FD164_453 [Nitrospirae bacterium]|nr:MAG: hypothetical protein FD164_453 [Nitrospirota bacterium]
MNYGFSKSEPLVFVKNAVVQFAYVKGIRGGFADA